MKFIVDKEINLNPDKQGVSNDMLHTTRYADILLQSIKNAPQGESYTIGLFGEWGSGKSSVIATMSEKVSTDTQLQKIKIVKYDAWKYSGDSFRRMFLYELRNALGINESPLMQRFYIHETHETKIKTSINWKKVGTLIFFVVLAIVVVAVLHCIFGIVAAIPSGIALISLLFSLWNFIFDQLKVTVQKPLLFAPEQFEECFKEIVGCSTRWDRYKEKTLKWITLCLHHEQYQRIIIIVDNIDRCQPDKAYTLLTDIKNFLCKEFDVVFIVPVDIYALRKHIVKSSTESNSIDADEFLRKFFNTSIWMRAYQNDEMYDFAKGLVDKHSLGYKPDTISLVANDFATNPRRLIQLFNNLQIELSMYPKEFAEEHQALICKLLVIREEFPAYYRQLMKRPSLLFEDVAQIRVKNDANLSDDEKALLANTRLYSFLHASMGVSSRYEQREDVVIRILANYQTLIALPENIRSAYRTANVDALLNYAQESKNRELLLNYLQDNIKKMVRRQTISAEGKRHIDVLLTLYDHELLTADDMKRLFNPIESPTTLSMIINLYRDQRALIRLGKELEALRLPKLTCSIESNLSRKDFTGNPLTEDEVKNIFYAASLWPVERCKSISENFLDALKINPMECRNYEFSKEKFDTLFTDEVYKYIIEMLGADNCDDEDSTFQIFRYLCHIQAVTKERLMDFIKEATAIAPTYDYKKPQENKVQIYMKALSEVFEELRYLGRVALQSEMTKLFDKINNASSEIISVSHVRTETRHHSFISEMASDEITADVINNFFANVNLITDGPVISNAEIERFIKVEDNRDKVLNTLMYLKEQGIDVSIWTNAVLTDPRRLDVRRIEILKSTFVRKEEDGAYVVADNLVKSEIVELINIIQTKADGHEALTAMLEEILEDDRVNRIVREVLATKNLEDQKQLPPSLMQRATESFERHIQELSLPKDVNVLQIIASHGSDDGIDGVWGIINPILADCKTGNQKIIDSAIQILFSFKKFTAQQAEALVGNVKAMPTNKVPEPKKQEIQKFIEGHILE